VGNRELITAAGEGGAAGDEWRRDGRNGRDDFH
jgi:hypothetical protein